MRRLADGVERRIVGAEITAQHKEFIETRDMFWLATVDHEGRPTVSYKGGDPGFVRVLDTKTIAFPCYDGNGMFYSMGNLMGNSKVGMLLSILTDPAARSRARDDSRRRSALSRLFRSSDDRQGFGY
jgi:predicted pyridoxine 5'-phosphate oxidase superfamily flavin-nucleotide-binding protein